MSGLEIAGLILGALPLVIAALEHYTKGLNTAKRYWRYKAELRSLILSIITEQTIFENTLEQLLTGIVRVEQMDHLLSDPTGPLWHQADTEVRLQKRLAGAYDTYVRNVRGMNIALQTMMEKLALDAYGKTQCNDPSHFKQEYKRLRFSLSKAEHAEQLSQLQYFNRALTLLTQQSRELEYSRAKTKSQWGPNFEMLQRLAKNLYDALKLGVQCAGGCQGHAIKLRLESRTNDSAGSDEVLEATSYRVIFVRSSDLQWKEADVRCLASSSGNVPLTDGTPISTDATPTQKHVRFSQLNRQSQRSDSGSGTTVTIIQRQSSAISFAEPKRMQTLCETIQRLDQAPIDPCIGYLLDSTNTRHCVFVPNAINCLNRTKWKSYTLHDLLAGRANTGARLTRHDKLRIAADLASSLLQLHQTPWLDGKWGLEDISFVQRPGSAPSTTYTHAFVSRDLSPHLSSSSTSHPTSTSRVIRNQTLFSFGVLLLELWYGKPIEYLKTTLDEDWQGTPSIAWCTAQRIIDNEIEFEAGKRYADAVRRCVRCEFDSTVNDLNHKGFQRAVFNGVVVPLQTTLQDFIG